MTDAPISKWAPLKPKCPIKTPHLLNPNDNNNNNNHHPTSFLPFYAIAKPKHPFFVICH